MNLIDFARIARDFDFDLNPMEVYNHLKEFDKDIKITIEGNCFWYELPNLDFVSKVYKLIDGEWYSEEDADSIDTCEPASCADIFFDATDSIKFRVWRGAEGYPESLLKEF